MYRTQQQQQVNQVVVIPEAWHCASVLNLSPFLHQPHSLPHSTTLSTFRRPTISPDSLVHLSWASKSNSSSQSLGLVEITQTILQNTCSRWVHAFAAVQGDIGPKIWLDECHWQVKLHTKSKRILRKNITYSSSYHHHVTVFSHTVVAIIIIWQYFRIR